MESETPGAPRDTVQHWQKWAVLRPAWQSGHAARRRTGHVRGDAEGDRDPRRPTSTSSISSRGGATHGSTSRGPGRRCSTCSPRRARRECRSGVLIWDAPRVPGFGNQSLLADAAVPALNRIPNCFAQQDNAGGAKSHHQKLLVVKGSEGLIAFCGGVDINTDSILTLPAATRLLSHRPPADLGGEVRAVGVAQEPTTGDPPPRRARPSPRSHLSSRCCAAIAR